MVAMSSRDVDVKGLMKKGQDNQEMNETYLMLLFRRGLSAVARGDLGKLRLVNLPNVLPTAKVRR